MHRAVSAGFEGESLEQGPSNRRLGHRFETCVSAWFQHHPEWDIKAANHVVQLGKRTAGEIDLLVERAGETLHLELAVKFYLSTAGSAQWDTWVGVDPVDRLDLKLDKFKTQVALSTQPEVASHLKQFGWEVDERSVWMKGGFSNISSAWPRPFSLRMLHPTATWGGGAMPWTGQKSGRLLAIGWPSLRNTGCAFGTTRRTLWT